MFTLFWEIIERLRNWEGRMIGITAMALDEDISVSSSAMMGRKKRKRKKPTHEAKKQAIENVFEVSTRMGIPRQLIA
jgi:hypothetical protein